MSRRKPFYWRSRNAWYLRLPGEGGKLKTIRLADTEAEAMAIWTEHYKPAMVHKPVAVAPAVADRSSPPAADPSNALPLEAAGRRPSAPVDKSPSPRRSAAPSQPRPKPPAEPRFEESRLQQFARILTVAELVAPLRLGATFRDLAHDIGDVLGQSFCVRTIQRDCQLLESLGIVGIEQRRREPAKVRWLAGSVRAAVVQRMADTMAERFDDDTRNP